MVRGPRPKPTAVRELDGNRGHRRLNRSEVQFPAAMVGDCPAWLSEEATEEWDRLAPALIRLRLLSGADLVVFAAYCQCYATYVKAQRVLNEEGLTVVTKMGEFPRPEVGIVLKHLEQIRKLASEFGLTPSARGRIEIEKVAPHVGPNDVETENEEQLIAELEELRQKEAKLSARVGRGSGSKTGTAKPTIQ